LVAAQCWADEGVQDEAQRFQARIKLAQQRASAWRLRAQNARNGLTVAKGTSQTGVESHGRLSAEAALIANACIGDNKGKQAAAKQASDQAHARRCAG
jgi:hypothetical protein